MGLDWQEALPNGGDTLGWDVTLEALIEFVEQASWRRGCAGADRGRRVCLLLTGLPAATTSRPLGRRRRNRDRPGQIDHRSHHTDGDDAGGAGRRRRSARGGAWPRPATGQHRRHAAAGHTPGAPDYEILVAGPRGSALHRVLQDTLARAKRLRGEGPQQRRPLDGASVERHGTVTTVWVELTDRTARRRIQDCVRQES